jgi:hypothetical protein
MREEPSAGELSRRLNDISSALQRATTQELFVAEQRHIERRFNEIERDLQELRRRHDDELRALTSRLESRDQQRGANWRQGVYAGIIPAALFLISLLVQIWLTTDGSVQP